MDETSDQPTPKKRGRAKHPIWKVLCEESEAELAHTMQHSIVRGSLAMGANGKEA